MLATSPFVLHPIRNKPFLLIVFSSQVLRLMVGNLCAGNAERCDLFSGQWIGDPSGPAYTNMSCNFIEPPQNCLKNGRPDTSYLYWRWKPYGCELPQFDPFKFMDTIKDKSWAFIGDSIFRNHIQSMLCLLSKVHKFWNSPFLFRLFRFHYSSCNFPLIIPFNFF